MSAQLRPAAQRRSVWPFLRTGTLAAGALTVGALAVVAPVACVLGGCGRAPEVRLLEVRSLGPARVERGELLRVTGFGFPAGRVARLRLEGAVARPAESARAVSLTLSGRAVSPERLEARVDDALLARLGGGGTFRGRVEIAFDAAMRDAEPVSGAREDVVVLFVEPTAARLSRELSHARAAADLLAFLGVKSSADAETGGVRLGRVGEGSRGEVAGLREGDVVDESDGAIVASLGDLAPPRDARAVVWRVTRASEAAPRALTLRLRGLGGTPDPEWSWAAALVALAWLAVMLRVAPTARLVDAAQRLLGVAARARTTRRELQVALAAGLVAALVAAVPHLPSVLDVTSLFGALFAIRLVAAARGGSVGRRARLVRALTLEVAGGLALGAIAVHAGTLRFAGLAAAQALAPLTLGVLAGPVPLTATLLLLRVACVPEAAESGRAGAFVDGESARLALSAALVALVAFGGASSTVAGAHYALGALALGPIAALISLAAARFRGLDRGLRLDALVLAACTLIASVALVALPPPATVDTMLSRACVALVFGALLVGGASLVSRRVRAHAERRSSGRMRPA